MKLATQTAGADTDPRETTDTEVIDLASRTSYPVVANRNPRSDALGLAAGIGFVALLGAATLWALNSTRLEDEAAEGQVLANDPAQQPVLPGTGSPTAGLPSANANAVAAEVEPPIAPQGAVLARAPEPGRMAGPTTNPYNSPTLVFDGSAAPTANAGGVQTGAAVPAAPDGGVVPGAGGAGEFAARIGGVGGGPATATQDFNPATTVTQGTMIPAILETAINTDVPGYVRAVVSQDVRSHDGARVLIPRSSRLVGQYQSGLQAGQRRAYVIWERVIRPDGVSVQLRSPATAFDGTAGLEGDVDSHFFSRFGSAMLLSVIGGLTTIASGGASVVLGGGQSAASTALQQDGQRPPTIRVRMGEPIRVYTARDLDFGAAPRVR
ncbi:TrbI/VirB10 family protein [Aurantiacibacter sp. D1-12]|uniref:TrbI/VirB10 family protein n=1 Tax=Aurantiacibacter sp. D1-12 TaxID=2993658 RepID=UPI00237CA9D3|nr:TrbI/VirB10 family protein [Aurantiacibacter sp. D1-12]MDE1467587.1 type VI secretion protein [Aurantiacibacter sp. D1-12]